ncbi:MAG: chalcone isomerase family protein [Desulfotignum sp.]|nr:chalcone isomerase family protein [Desulfotignum sp.]
MDIQRKALIAIVGAWSWVVFFVTGPVYAAVTTVEGTAFSNTVTVNQTRLDLQGAALLRYMYFIEAYTGALYLPDTADGSLALEDISKHLVLEYRVAISAEDFARATEKKIRESVSEAEFQRLLPKITALNRLYRDVVPRDRYALTYIPGSGTVLTYNSTPLGTIEGHEFARAVFSIWIGANPIDKGFRDKLLGKQR